MTILNSTNSSEKGICADWLWRASLSCCAFIYLLVFSSLVCYRHVRTGYFAVTNHNTVLLHYCMYTACIIILSLMADFHSFSILLDCAAAKPQFPPWGLCLKFEVCMKFRSEVVEVKKRKQSRGLLSVSGCVWAPDWKTVLWVSLLLQWTVLSESIVNADTHFFCTQAHLEFVLTSFIWI